MGLHVFPALCERISDADLPSVRAAETQIIINSGSSGVSRGVALVAFCEKELFLHFLLRTQGQVVRHRFTTTVNFLTDATDKDNFPRKGMFLRNFSAFEKHLGSVRFFK